MNIQNLRYFLAVAEDGNMTKAAERLFITQQALSSHIQRLENYYKVSLFERSPRGLTLTYAGRRLFITAKELLSREQQIREELMDIANEIQGELRIGIPPMRGRVLLPKILPEYRKQNPRVSLHLLEDNTPQLVGKILQNEIDVLIGVGPIQESCLEIIPLTKETIFFCVPKNMYHTDTIPLSFESCLHLPILLLSRGTPLRQTADTLLRKYNVTPDILLETKSIETLLELCSQGMGVTFYPEMFIDDSLRSKIHFFPLPELADAPSIVLAYRKDIHLSRAVRRFTELTVQKLTVPDL